MANQVDRRDLSCSRADPEGYGSPFNPYRVLPRAWTKARAASVEWRENVESLGKGGGPDGDRPSGPNDSHRQDGKVTRRHIVEGGDTGEILWS